MLKKSFAPALALGLLHYHCAVAAPDVSPQTQVPAVPDTSTQAGQCEFPNEPVGVGYFWDPTCKEGMVGCHADGKHLECRFCGAGDEYNVSCPSSSCKFANEPYIPYYWDHDCEVGKLGCWADGIHPQCRFCGDFPYTGVPCPKGTPPPKGAACAFENEPETPYFWDASCEMGIHGCNADGVNVHCRFCGSGVFSDIPCMASQVCSFGTNPAVPYYWDPQCGKDQFLGCNADGVHMECRYCASRPFEDVPCPGQEEPGNACEWPLNGKPAIAHLWDPSCKMGMLGCWADGRNAECRFCGEGAFEDIACPNVTDANVLFP